MINFYEGKPVLYYYQKMQVKHACEWFWRINSVKMSIFEMANFVKKMYQYEDLIITMAYTLFLENIHPDEINFKKLVDKEIFINPFINT